MNEPGAEVGRVLALVEAQPAAADAALGTAGWLQRLCRVALSDLPAWGVAVSLMTEERSSGLAAASDATCGSVEELQFLLGEGPFLDAGDSTLSITGGTGAYRAARGTMDLHARDAQGSAYDFTFHVLG